MSGSLPQLTGAQILDVAGLNAAAAAAPAIAKAISDVLVSQNARELGHYIASCIAQNTAQYNYTTTLHDAVPHGAVLRFWLANTDDSTTVRCEGLVFDVARGSPPKEEFLPLNTAGPNVIMVEVDNSTGGPWAVTLHVDVQHVSKPARMITIELGGPNFSDPMFQAHKRNFIFPFTVN